MRNKLSLKLWDFSGIALANLVVLLMMVVYLLPISYMAVTAVKQEQQFGDPNAPIWPSRHVQMDYEGESYSLYTVPLADGERPLLLITPRRSASQFIDPVTPESGLIEWQGNWRQLQPVYESFFTFDAFTSWFERLDLRQVGYNTLIVVGLTEIGVVITSILVAYGFARFPIPYGNTLFLILIGTIILPEKITLVPTYFAFINVLDWQGTWWPLVAPYFFGSAVLIFLLRQNFRSIPRELEEAAMIDGAGPLRILVSVILPMAWPTVLTVALLHFFFIWNETRLASLYLLSAPDKHPLVSGLVARGGTFGVGPNNVQARALITMVVPTAVLFLSQRFFMRGVQITGLEK
ncbi:MAG: carbohydrate ABC transporter permease [Chloroflexota bacterium]